MNDPTGRPADPESSSERQLTPATFAQQRLWFLDQLQPEKVAYLIAWSIPFRGALDPATLGRALEEVVNRHDGAEGNLPTERRERSGWPFLST